MRKHFLQTLCALLLALTGVSNAETLSTKGGEVEISTMLSGLDEPWGVDILPDGSFLVTERDGVLLHVENGKATKLRGLPKVAANGQGGMLDVTVARDFAQTREIFLTYAKPRSTGAVTALATARLNAGQDRLSDLRVLFEARMEGRGGRHFGSRVVEARDGMLFVTLGERGAREAAQDPTTHNGKVIRIARDGSIPGDNPFVNKPGYLHEIWSMGHRNPQGAGLDRRGRLLVSEHGAKGGDEVNLIKKGANYGWPVISYGRHYSGQKIGEGTHKPGLEQPLHFWDPSIAPSGLLVYSGKLWPQWKDHVFVGSLKFDYISRLAGGTLREVEQIKGDQTERVRDIIEAPDGAIWFISVGQGTVYRMTPG